MKKYLSLLSAAAFIVCLIPITPALAITQNQINAEVQVVCPDNYGNWWSGSGTIIDSKGIILTNKHVVTDEHGGIIQTCFIGFVSSISQEPDFGTKASPNLAEVKYYTTSSDMDAAMLYINNPTNKIYPFVDIWTSDSSALKFGDKIEVIGYPSIGGSTITYTSGDFSGFGSSSDGTQNYIKTSVPLEHGNSGGAAYDAIGKFIGIPSMVVAGKLNSLSYVLSINSIKNWLSGILGSNYSQSIIQLPTPSITTERAIQPDITPPDISQVTVQFYDCSRFYTLKGSLGQLQSTKYPLYPSDCIPLTYDPNKSYNISPETIYEKITLPDVTLDDVYTWDEGWFTEPRTDQFMGFGTRSEENRVEWLQFLKDGFIPSSAGGEVGNHYLTIQLYDKNGNASQAKSWQYNYSKVSESVNISPTTPDTKLINRMRGYILLQVESHGEAWYVNPADGKRYYMKDGSTAYEMMRKFGLGITDADLAKMPQEGEKNNYPSLVNNLKGKILLQVQEHGEAWYIDPKSGYRYYMKDGDAAYSLMRYYSLGITNSDLGKIPEGTL